MITAPEFARLRQALIELVTSQVGPLLREVPIRGDDCVMRWRDVSITLRVNRRQKLPPTADSYMNQDFPPLPYVVDREGDRHYHNAE